jgi:hypothetical protein
MSLSSNPRGHPNVRISTVFSGCQVKRDVLQARGLA